MFSGNQVRKSFINYFQSKDHQHVLSSPLIPHDDPSILFINAGMNQFKDVFLGKETPSYKRAVTHQKVIRAGGKHNDLENVGYTARHHTFFEMMGNFAFGDYFKKEAIIYAWDWLTKELKIPESKLAASVYYEDKESLEIWHKTIGLPYSKIAKLGEKDNFWSMGDSGPCGPCSEIHFDMAKGEKGGVIDSLEADDGRFLEIWNLVFMQFNRTPDGKLSPLPKPSIDTGCGLERICSVLQGVESNFDIDIFAPLVGSISEAAGIKYREDSAKDVSIKVIADHIRAAVFAIADGVIPGNEGRGYVLRRIIRRGLRHAGILGIEHGGFSQIAEKFLPDMWDIYAELKEGKQMIIGSISQEEDRFQSTLKSGVTILNEFIKQAQADKKDEISGKDIFKLYDTYGFPVDIATEMLHNEKLTFGNTEFDKAMEAQKTRARQAGMVNSTQDLAFYQEAQARLAKQTFIGYELKRINTKALALFQDNQQVDRVTKEKEFSILLDKTPFYATAGGQVGDIGVITSDYFQLKVMATTKPFNGFNLCQVRVVSSSVEQLNWEHFAKVNAKVDLDKRKLTSANHTATHLLHSALREVLGSAVKQAGSYVDFEKLRFDFNSNKSLSHRELAEIESIVNKRVMENQLVTTKEMPYKEALQMGAMAFFGDKYGDLVRVVKAGSSSVELCGGTHATRTGDISFFKIISEQSVAAGLRRIEAFTGQKALGHVNFHLNQTEELSKLLSVKTEDLADRIKILLKNNNQLEKQVAATKLQMIEAKIKTATDNQKMIKSDSFVWINVPIGGDLKSYANLAKQHYPQGLSVLWQPQADNKGVLALAVGAKEVTKKIKANDMLKKIMPQINGKGGGRADFAQCSCDFVDPKKMEKIIRENFYANPDDSG
ncbi:MAG: alanine--tRNA ligase [SAR324 cluster bacterium]|nr:alanine--tRNA ligase [SAR324 cluster bacterium]